MAKKRRVVGDGVIRPIDHFDGVHALARPQDRLREVRKRAARFREEMLGGPVARYYGSHELVRVPYPTRYGFLNVRGLHTPFMHIVNRLFIVQFDTESGVKTLLVSPSDADANAETPFFKRLSDSFGPAKALGQRLIAPKAASVEQILARVGVAPEAVDYITYDHLHTQDVRRWMGTKDRPGLFPNAKLLVMRQEWESTLGLLPPQRQWYCPNGIKDIDETRVVLLDSDVQLGECVWLVRTPGHTEGNHSIVVHTPEGLMVTSENGVGPDAYAPLHSDMAAVREYAYSTGMEVVMNGNTLERAVDQYISMVLEKEIAGPSVRDERFPNVVCSSEFGAYWAFPGIKPSFQFGDLEFGLVSR
ncbi:MAG: hypothetical protein H0U74_17005 [Bradymonadaceae bacterium]|nr:hypothetical protein [Lujinxingiaceae bacterium]